ncbi:MAG: RNA repair domain-containing protein [Candidatus Asgardarchaeia archaeon]
MPAFKNHKKKTIKSILKQIVFDKRLNPSEYYIIYRGSHDMLEKLFVSDISLERYGFTIRNDGTYIPYHRIIEIGNEKTGEIIIKRRFPSN